MTLFQNFSYIFRANLWIRACNREDLVDKTCEALSKNYRLCEKHFEDQCFVGSGKKRKHLAHDAVPTLFAHHDHDEPKRKIRILSGEYLSNGKSIVTSFFIYYLD